MVNEKDKQEMKGNSLQNLDEKVREEVELEAKQILVEAVMREVTAIARYVEFRMSELMSKGVIVNYSINREVGDADVKLIVHIKVHPRVIDYAVQRVAELRGFITRVRREARKSDRYKYRFD